MTSTQSKSVTFVTFTLMDEMDVENVAIDIVEYLSISKSPALSEISSGEVKQN